MEENKKMAALTEEQRMAAMLFGSEKGAVSYEVAGQEVKLSYTIVRNFLAKGNSEKVTDADLVQFIQVCKFNELNPFLNEAYLVKYGDAPAQMVVSKEALMKRAEANPNFDGFKAGIMVMRDGKVVELEGTFKLHDDVLIGGWAEVFRKDRRNPVKQTVNFSEYNTGKSLWQAKPTTMIRKVAVVQALREAFPAQLGAMYTQEEQVIEDVEYVDVTEKVAADVDAPKVEIAVDVDEKAVEAKPAKRTPGF